VSFSIQEREIFGIIGLNGAGKTTTVECISGLREPLNSAVTTRRSGVAKSLIQPRAAATRFADCSEPVGRPGSGR
jgi:ABC-type multidrug transport system ATPase subunit